MRAGLSTIQQTLTPEAANVLNLSIAEAGRRNHGQTTPLHVAATLLSSPSGFLRQACIRSHPNSSHPLQCRALELCFSVALERLPTAQSNAPAAMEPPISNALMAALKRAQAHQRRGCPEQQQQPLLAVKVELEQLIISILDDPSVSRVMREASFSSPAVKATIEQSLNSQSPGSVNPSTIGNIGFRPNPIPMQVPNRNPYLNPRLQQGNLAQSGQQRSEEVKRVTDILLRTKKKNPVLVGDLQPETVVRELLRKIQKGELGEGPLKNVQVIPLEKGLTSDKSQIPNKLKELGGLIETKMGSCSGGGIILDLGDLKWIVEHPVSIGVPGCSGVVPQQVVSEAGRAAVAEMAKLLARFGDGSSGRLWLIGTATCETYLRCQVYHPSMENDWDLQAVPIASRSPLPGMFPRLGANAILSSSVESLSPLVSFPTPNALNALPRRVSENVDPARRMGCCQQCTENYEQELAELVAKEYEKSSSEIKLEAAQPPLPQWLQNAKALNSDNKTMEQPQTKDQEMLFKAKSQELQKKWSDTCTRLHWSLSPERTNLTSLPMTGLYNPNLLVHQPYQLKLQQTRHVGETLKLNSNPVANQPPQRAGSRPGSPVRTDLVLGRTKIGDTTPEKALNNGVKDLLGSNPSEQQPNFLGFQVEKFASEADADSFKKLLKGLMEKLWWQQEAASAVATAITQCKLGNGKRQGTGSRGDIWLLFTGPDRVGKKKMAFVLSEKIYGTNPMTISLGSRRDDEESDMRFRGRTVIDQIGEAVRRNRSSVIMIEDIDEADMLVRGSIKRAMESGRLADSHGREISLGNVIFVLSANWLPDNLKDADNNRILDEKKLASVAGGGWQLRLYIGEKSAKRRANWLHHDDDDHRSTKARKEMGSGLSFDLNLLADAEDDRTDGSHNSSDLTIDHEDDQGLENCRFSMTTVPHELVSSVDSAIDFKPVEIALIRRRIKNSILEKFSAILDDKHSLELEEEALEKIIGGVWLGRTSLEEWAEKVLVPSFQQLKGLLPPATTGAASSDETVVVVRLESDSNSGDRSTGDWLPSKITVKVDAV